MSATDPSQMLAEERRVAEAFCELLDRERDALLGDDLERVAAFAEEKLILAAQLKIHADRRNSLAPGLHRLASPSAQASLLSAPDKDWESVRELLARAQDANRLNGLLITSRLSAIGSAISALHGAAGHSALYQRDGSASLSGMTSASARWSA